MISFEMTDCARLTVYQPPCCCTQASLPLTLQEHLLLAEHAVERAMGLEQFKAPSS
jgi:hypothetical protein